MVVVKGKTQTQASSPLSIAPKNEAILQKEALSFSQLLQGYAKLTKNIKNQKSETDPQITNSLQNTQAPQTPKSAKSAKNIQNATRGMVLRSEIAQKSEVVSSHSKQSEKTELKKSSPQTLADLLQFSSEKDVATQLTTKFTPSELKALIYEAKEYLKTKITQTDGFKNAEIAELPKTLKGLTQVAQKLGIDLAKITLEEVRSRAKESTAKITPKEQTVQNIEEPKKEPSAELTAKESRVKTVEKTKTTTASQPNVQMQTQTQVQTEQKSEHTTQRVAEHKTELKDAPLLKAQTKTEMSTQEITVAKAATIEMQKPKEKADENLKLLLRTQSSQKNEAGFTADFSVASAKVIAPSLTQTQTQTQHNTAVNLESFLQGKSSEESSGVSKLETNLTAKAESVEVKINEAKQMMKYLSQDVKTAIEDYKSPFTRIKVQLNPQRLGEVDLTVVQRGNNLHVTLSSNNAAINTLAMNANELKTQLTNSGINNATLNFSNNPQSQDGSASQQQNSHQRREEARKEYAFAQNEELHEEIVSSLEIVVAHYA